MNSDIFPGASQRRTSVFGVPYEQVHFPDGTDLYLTSWGIPLAAFLNPGPIFTDPAWFHANALRLSGTSSLYRVHSPEIGGRRIEFVLKWNRMGQEVPIHDETSDLWAYAFNSPFEEFQLVMAMRNAGNKDCAHRVLTHKPLAIYVAPGSIELDRSGRQMHRMHPKLNTHMEVQLDIYRQYAVIYEWIKGMDAAEACDRGLIDKKKMEALTLDSRRQLLRCGFTVGDSKPHHVIVRPDRSGKKTVRRGDDPVYALVDFELLQRSATGKSRTRRLRRSSYLRRQLDRFIPRDPSRMPSHLELVRVLDVPYIHGSVPSTGGLLWVVGNDPDLFDYFLPERWENTARTKLSMVHEIYHTLTKDNINLVWQVSRMGRVCEADPWLENEERMLNFGYNSPFEEVKIALHLDRHGVETTYPRAIYASAKINDRPPPEDRSRYFSHASIKLPNGQPVLDEQRTYIVIWGFWNGPDERLVNDDSNYYEAVDALQCLREELLTLDQYKSVVQTMRTRLKGANVEDLNFRGNHILLSQDADGRLVSGKSSGPQGRICNFEFLRVVSGDKT